MTTGTGKGRGWRPLDSVPRGERNGMAKVTASVVRQIRAARYSEEGRRGWPAEHPCSLKSLAARFGLSVTAVSHIARGRRWRHVKA